MKVTGVENEIRGRIKYALRKAVLEAMDEYGFARPDKFAFTYDIAKAAIVMRVQFGKWCVNQLVDEDFDPMVARVFVEQLALDANVPIAEEL